MFERISLKSEEGQGATEYAMVIAFIVVTLGLGLGLMGGAIVQFLTDVATEIGLLI